MALYIPARSVVPKPDKDDPLDYYYLPVTSLVYRARLEMAIKLLGGRKYNALLEVGYGSGILLPELARHSKRIVGLDLHPNPEAVYKMLAHEKVKAELHQGSLFEMPFNDGEFDALICLSVLEHLTELDKALTEFARVTKPGATLVLAFPVRNLVTDAFFRLVGYDPRAIHPSGHRDIERAILRHPDLMLDQKAIFPWPLPADVALYYACRCHKVA
ncbi:MAG: class I SAM-dependent methyltransferase [Chloroflexota bacterium]